MTGRLRLGLGCGMCGGFVRNCDGRKEGVGLVK